MARTLDRFEPDRVLIEPKAKTSYLAGVRAGLLSEAKEVGHPRVPIIATGSHVLGPIRPVSQMLDQMDSTGAGLFAPYWHATEADPRTKNEGLPSHIPYLDFAIFGAALQATDEFREFWQAFEGGDHWTDFRRGLGPFAHFLKSHGHDILYPLELDELQTSDPRLYEVHSLVKKGCPCLPLEVFSLDPLLHDINAISLRPALDFMRQGHPAAYQAAIDHACQTIPMREFNANADQFEILPTTALQPDKSEWNFGTVAVFIHAYYPEMIVDLAGLVENIPARHHLFVTTASEENKQTITNHLLDRGYSTDAIDVRVVEHNRGRDMSALFITFRDVILSDKYQVALRLHSKRTPQVSPRVAEEFKTHLFDNLVGSRGYVHNLLDKMEAEPDLGLLIPPIIHIGFGTLGHSWFNNFQPTRQLADEMKFNIPLDTVTPVAPNGTMYWFRTHALRKMFEWPWEWEKYNKEPHHVDGGLAHVQERLIGYCAQAAGYRVLSVMTPQSAARNYAKLEYKMQRLMSHLSSGNIVEQDFVLSKSRTNFRGKVFRFCFEAYGRTIRRWPASRRWLRPLAQSVRKLLTPSVRTH
ncbi:MULTISPECIES: rhamnan synthesis F family protein [unclassified Sulfitobacter]|nr:MULTISPECIES: rhamnan synthesis F family protein [unclassified Sulfitobacter]